MKPPTPAQTLDGDVKKRYNLVIITVCVMDLEAKTMTTSAILKAINALPVEERIMIIEQVVHAIRLENSDSPSPSGDSWFDDPQNIAIVKEGIKTANEDKEIILTSKEDIKNYFVNL